jgi:hypothetical protein
MVSPLIGAIVEKVQDSRIFEKNIKKKLSTEKP